jgi:nitrogen fixation protein NifU and related proteins
MGELDEIYQRALRMHYEQPHNYGRLDDATSSGRATNPVCGDEVAVYLAMGPAGARAASFDGHLCAISKASASLMTDAVVGKSAAEIGHLREEFGRMMRGDDAVSLGTLDALKGVRRYRVRVRCALLPWEALETALKG